jgi:hypothetical protein
MRELYSFAVRAAKENNPEYFSGGFDIMKKLQKKLVKEQGKKAVRAPVDPYVEPAFGTVQLQRGTIVFTPKHKPSDPSEPALIPGDKYQEWTGTEWIEKVYKGQ